MERESNQLEAGPILCRMGCGFFGSPNTDGLCSKCYKDALKKKQQPPNTSPTSSTSSSITPTPAAASSSPSPVPTAPSLSPLSSATLTTTASSTTTGQPTVPPLSQVAGISGATDKHEGSDGEVGAVADGDNSVDGDLDSGSPDKDGAKKKKNKCQMCKKKVGLTGFTCRCEGLFCSVHRYSNEHRCTFDYREHGAEEIRRNNPVIKGEKIQKI